MGSRWHLHKGLLLNQSKTEALVTGTRQQVVKMDSVAGIDLAGAVIPFAKTVKVLGVSIDQHLTFNDHISKVAGSFHYHIRALRHIHRLIDRETANTLPCSTVATRLDYCNSVLSGHYSQEHHTSTASPKFTGSGRLLCTIP